MFSILKISSFFLAKLTSNRSCESKAYESTFCSVRVRWLFLLDSCYFLCRKWDSYFIFCFLITVFLWISCLCPIYVSTTLTLIKGLFNHFYYFFYYHWVFSGFTWFIFEFLNFQQYNSTVLIWFSFEFHFYFVVVVEMYMNEADIFLILQLPYLNS